MSFLFSSSILHFYHRSLLGKLWLSIYYTVTILLEKDDSTSHYNINVYIYLSVWNISEKTMAAHSSTLAWEIPWMEEPGRLQSMGLWRVRHDWVTSLSLFTFMHWRRKWQPTPVFLPGESRDCRAWSAAVYGVAQSWTRLTWLSSSSTSMKYLHTFYVCVFV